MPNDNCRDDHGRPDRAPGGSRRLRATNKAAVLSKPLVMKGGTCANFLVLHEKLVKTPGWRSCDDAARIKA